jgi:hypothetical protein
MLPEPLLARINGRLPEMASLMGASRLEILVPFFTAKQAKINSCGAYCFFPYAVYAWLEQFFMRPTMHPSASRMIHSEAWSSHAIT